MRTALAVSSILSVPVEVKNIRAGRANPGLRPSHLAAIRALSSISSAEVRGDSVGSSTVSFVPGDVSGGSLSIETGTAGSISLIIQALLPVMLFSGKDFQVSLSGGTDVAWSPPIDHTREVLFPVLRGAGADIFLEVIRRGYYPKGGGKVILRVSPSSLDGISLSSSGINREGMKIRGHLHISGLPPRIARRLMGSADCVLQKSGVSADWEVEVPSSLCPQLNCSTVSEETLSPGVSATLWASGKSFSIGSSDIGRRGAPAERIGKDIASSFLKDMESGASVDIHTADQLPIYMAMARILNGQSSSFNVRELSNHTLTTLRLLEKMTGVGFERVELDGLWSISVR